jgi:uncharacterized membrane protein
MYTKLRFEVPQLLVLIGMFAAAGVLWSSSPESFPVHWNIHGNVDRYGSRFEGLLLVPLIAAGLYALLLVLPQFDPGRANYQSFLSAYFAIRLSILVFLAVIYTCMLLVAFGHSVNMNSIIPFAMCALFVILGSVMSSIRPNWFVGVRTPWTLSSRLSWDKTHRLAGRLFMAMGAVVGLLGLIQTAWMLAVTVTFVVGSVLGILIYSYIVWRNDPERTAPTLFMGNRSSQID